MPFFVVLKAVSDCCTTTVLINYRQGEIVYKSQRHTRSGSRHSSQLRPSRYASLSQPSEPSDQPPREYVKWFICLIPSVRWALIVCARKQNVYCVHVRPCVRARATEHACVLYLVINCTFCGLKKVSSIGQTFKGTYVAECMWQCDCIKNGQFACLLCVLCTENRFIFALGCKMFVISTPKNIRRDFDNISGSKLVLHLAMLLLLIEFCAVLFYD